jgi:integrase
VLVFQRFTDSLPDKKATLLKNITKAHCIAFRNAYSELPRRIPDKLRGLSVGDILKSVKSTKYIRLTHNTVNQALIDLRHLFTWAIRHDHYNGKNPVEGIEYEGVKGKSYEPFSDADIKATFNHPDFLDQRNKYPARYWLPLILLFSGARRSEIDQLSLADIRQDDHGIWFMDLKFDEESGKRLKNTVSIRRVPVHSHLLEVGLMEYVADLRKRKQSLLFAKPEQQRKRGKGRDTVGDQVGKWWGRLLKSAGVTGNKNLHSLRHTVITRLTAAGVPQDMREILVGHAAGNVHGQIYTHRDQIPLSLLRQHLEKLNYTGLLST